MFEPLDHQAQNHTDHLRHPLFKASNADQISPIENPNPMELVQLFILEPALPSDR